MCIRDAGYPPPGSGYPPPGYPWQPPMALQPGVIPLRPLSLSDIFNGAVRYIRANPKASLGLTAIVVVIAQVIALILEIGPLAVGGELGTLAGGGEPDSATALIGSAVGSVIGALSQALALLVLSGMLTVVVGRAVFGSPISIGEAWARIRDRILPLLGLTLLEGLGLVLAIGVVALFIAGLAAATNATVTVLIGVPLGLAVLVGLVWVYTVISFAPVAIVLERRPVIESIQRSWALVRSDFWRVFGIRLLAGIVTTAVAGAIAIPFSIGQLVAAGNQTAAAIVLGSAVGTVGAIIGQIVTTPFSAGVIVLLYTDRRIRAEAFDLVLRTGATAGPAPAASTDHLWLTRQ
ncbi:DUF7847 domain-containing protein [Mycolicibacterium palauense]|uniref:DUF7847 domain-containing protein n=1 Tax=Mycolicibacterium palauense TaxID=2034511 RepID=UPI0011454A57|nr:hypothetical protein [Mycolicibacterium palauense]